MRRLLGAVVTAVLASTTLTACAGGDRGAAIVVTTNILGDVTRELVGEQADVEVLMEPDADPHSFEISAAQAGEMERADLLVANGLGLEEGLAQHLSSAEAAGTPVLEAGDSVDVIEYTSDDASGPDPHWWTDPARMLTVVDALERGIARHVDGVDVDRLAVTADAYRARLAELDAAMTRRFAALGPERRVLVTNHHVFGYLAQRFDFEVVGAVVPGGSTLAAPSAKDLESLATAVTEAGVPTIFADSSQPDRLVQVLAEEAGVDVAVEELFTESLTAPGGGASTYLELMTTNTDRITRSLQ